MKWKLLWLQFVMLTTKSWLQSYSVWTSTNPADLLNLLEDNMAMKVEIRDNKLCIEIDLEKPTPSASGKTLVVASTRGNAVTDAMVDGKPVTIGLNAYIKP